MAFTLSVGYEPDQAGMQVIFEESSSVRKVILSRPSKLNSLTYTMVSQILRKVEKYEHDPRVSCVILKAKGKAFCAGGDVASAICVSLGGHWSHTMQFYRKQCQLDYMIATYSKPVVAIIHGIVMGGGAGLSLQATFRIVTEKTVFAMPEVSIGLFPDVGASYFLSRLPGFFGEYLALTGARLDGAEMLECGLATHFVLSKDLSSLEKALCEQISHSASSISEVLARFGCTPTLKQDRPFRRLETTINRCFSRSKVEEILSLLEKEIADGGEKWTKEVYKSMKGASPTMLKVTLRSIREGRMQNLNQCLKREFNMGTHAVKGSVNRDFYEGSRALLFDKDNKPKWDPPTVEMVSDEMVDVFFTEVEDPDYVALKLRQTPSSKL